MEICLVAPTHQNTLTLKRLQKKCFDDFDETLGHIIRRERSTQVKSITDVRLEVRFSKAYIIAIEDGHISVFRIRRFVRSYVR